MILAIRAGLAIGTSKFARTKLSRITRRFARREEGAPRSNSESSPHRSSP